MTPAEFDTRRRVLGLSIQEAADYLGVQRRTIERWNSGYSDLHQTAAASLPDLEDKMATAVESAVAQAAKPGVTEPVVLIRYRSQAAVDASPHAAGMPLGAHAAMIGWIADALEAEGIEARIEWGDD